ncbi:MAG: NAD(P)H-binding protein [Gemmatimonadaceae bacterium]
MVPASGGVGRWATRLAAAAGHSVTAFLRPGTSFEPPADVTVERGSATEAADLTRVVRQQDAIISCIGPQRVNPRTSGHRSSHHSASRGSVRPRSSLR